MRRAPQNDCHFIPQSYYVFNDDLGKEPAVSIRLRFSNVSAATECARGPHGTHSAAPENCAGPTIEAAIVSPYNINWDSNSNGQIQDGGGDMYDGGNRITTSLCGSQLAPYTDNMEPIASDCFGAGGSYMMDMFTSMMILLSQNTGTEPLTISIGGDSWSRCRDPSGEDSV